MFMVDRRTESFMSRVLAILARDCNRQADSAYTWDNLEFKQKG